MSKTEARISNLEKRADQHDREIAAIRKLLLQGAKMLVKVGEQQKKTEKSLDRFIHSLGGTNGSNNGGGKRGAA